VLTNTRLPVSSSSIMYSPGHVSRAKIQSAFEMSNMRRSLSHCYADDIHGLAEFWRTTGLCCLSLQELDLSSPPAERRSAKTWGGQNNHRTMCAHSDGSRLFGNDLVVSALRQHHNRNLQHDALAAALNDVLASIRWRDADHEESVSSRTRPILVLQWFR